MSGGGGIRLAIEPHPGFFPDRWMEYCDSHGIEYVRVDASRTDGLETIRRCDGFLWHWSQTDAKRILFARQLTRSLELAGVEVFPDSRTCWHFDDKLGQKYLFEAADVPMVPTYAFYDRAAALEWASKTNFPKVFKLRGGAGSVNVKLVRTRGDAEQLIRRMFARGIPAYDYWGMTADTFKKWRHGKTSFHEVLIRLRQAVNGTAIRRVSGLENGYVLFQDFIAGNESDIRVVVVGNRALSIRRQCRAGDFRASGSGSILFDRAEQNESIVALSFDAAKRLGMQCAAFDFLLSEGRPLLVECSYGFAMKAYDACPGWWDGQMNWHPGSFRPQDWMIEDLLMRIGAKRHVEGK